MKCRSTVARLVAVAAAISASGCALDLSKSSQGDATSNQCSSDSDCGVGACWSGMCVAHEGSLPTVLFEVTPPATVQDIGGVRFLQVAKGLTRSGSDYQLDLPPVSTVHGFVRAYDPKSSCVTTPDSASIPVQVTISPREQSYGLPAVSYAATTRSVPVTKDDPCASQLSGSGSVDEFVIALPKGKYDIYVAPIVTATVTGDAGVSQESGCVPQLFTNQDASATCLALAQGQPETLDVTVQSPLGPTSLDGFTVDVIHPVTGQVLSNQAVIGASPTSIDVGAGPGSGMGYIAHLSVSEIIGDDLVTPAQELVRLRPPAGTTAPTIELERSALQANFVPGKAVTPSFGQFPAPVELESWVWSAKPFDTDDQEIAVPSTVSLTATSLDGISPGVFASFSIAVPVGRKGKLEATVLPGDYRADAVPTAGQGLAATQTTLTVACAASGGTAGSCAPASPNATPPTQAGKLLLIPPAATLTGSVVAPFGTGRIDGASVQVLPASFNQRACGGVDGGDAAACVALPVSVLDQALGQAAFVPRAASAVAVGGRFTMAEVDCGGCTPGTGALFDLSVRPLEGTGFPWLVKESVAVSGDVDFAGLALPLPIIERGLVDVPQGSAAEPVPVAGALIRAYVVRDDKGNYVEDPDSLPSCATAPSGTPGPCNRSLIQVAETRAAPDGTFQLALPSTLN